MASPPEMTLFPVHGGKLLKAERASKRDPRLYLAKHGCTIESYQPDQVTMGAWAAERAPLVPNPLSPETVEDIKDVWRQRGVKPKDFDATYRTYLRKRQDWAAEAATKANEMNGSQKSRAAI